MRYPTDLTHIRQHHRNGTGAPHLATALLAALLFVLPLSVARGETADGKYDLDNNGLTNDADIAIMTARLNGSGPIADLDLNNDGVINAVDLVTLTNYLSGPSQRAIMVRIEASSFTMGRRDDGADGVYGADDELPRHLVNLSSYEIGKYEATNGLVAKILNWANLNGRLEDPDGSGYSGSGVYLNGMLLVDIASSYSMVEYGSGLFGWKYHTGAGGASYSMEYHPAVMVSWYGSLALSNWLSEMQGVPVCYDLTTWALLDSDDVTTGIQPYSGYRLPSEAEWECAAAWDINLTKHWIYGYSGDTLADYAHSNSSVFALGPGAANPLGFTGRPYTTPVGWYNGANIAPNGGYTTVHSRSPYGAYDMTGNVHEWCYDRYGGTYYSGGTMEDPFGPETGDDRTIKGGGYWSSESTSRTADRFPGIAPQTATYTVGLRFCRSLPTP